MRIYIKGLKEKPKSCEECPCENDDDCQALDSIKGECRNNPTSSILTWNACPLIEVDDELMIKLQESAIVIKAVFNRLKKMVNDSDELKAELIGFNPNLTIFDEANAIQDVESVGERRTDD